MVRHQSQLPHHKQRPLSATSSTIPEDGSDAVPASPLPPLPPKLQPQPKPRPFTLVPAPAQPSAESQCFAVTDMAWRHASENPICAGCASRMRINEVYQCRVLTGQPQPETCVVCAWKRGDAASFTKPYLRFMAENPTVFHTVAYGAQKLAAVGFEELTAREDWGARLRPGGRYYTTRNGSTLAAFTVGGGYVPGHGFAIIGGHIDALTARLKPLSSKPPKSGFVQLGVAPYAGALNATWWDRDLCIGGRVVVRDAASGKTATRLVKLDWPIAKIATLAPHFGKSMTGASNRETEMVPIIGLESSSSSSSSTGSEADAEPLGPAGSFVASQPPKLVKLIAAELGITAYTSIVNWELELFDGQPPTVFGLDKELISAGRIDDKVCSWAALVGLMRAQDNDTSGVVRMVTLFDDEEIGSLLRQGARSNFLPLTVERIVEGLAPAGTFGPGLVGRTYAASFLVSADVTHAVHPNFAANYLEGHAPQLNVGVAVVCDANGHMPTDSVSTAMLDRVAERCGATLQRFMIRNDSRSGGTIGPSLSSALGVKSADAGIPQLSMHSIRATTGALDPGLGVRFYQGFLEHWEAVDAEWQ